MRYTQFFFIFFCLTISSLFNSTFARTSPPQAASLVLDYQTGKVLYSNNSNIPVHPASLTKMMTLYLTFQNLQTGKISLHKKFRVSRYAANRPPTKLGLRAGQEVNVKSLILGVVTRSANDAAATLAEGIGGSEAGFVRMMNKKARALGMNHTTFYNASGLPNPNQYTTASDMALLGKALLRDFPNDYHYFSIRGFVYRGQLIKTHNHFLDSYKGADGTKTGYVDASGYNLVASAKRHNRRLIGVVFGDSSAKARDRHMAKLLDQCFKQKDRLG